jgi:hypothetical protein
VHKGWDFPRRLPEIISVFISAYSLVLWNILFYDHKRGNSLFETYDQNDILILYDLRITTEYMTLNDMMIYELFGGSYIEVRRPV